MVLQQAVKDMVQIKPFKTEVKNARVLMGNNNTRFILQLSSSFLNPEICTCSYKTFQAGVNIKSKQCVKIAQDHIALFYYSTSLGKQLTLTWHFLFTKASKSVRL